MEQTIAPEPIMIDEQGIELVRAFTDDLPTQSSLTTEGEFHTGRRFIVGVDFGTTFSSVSVLELDQGHSRDVTLRDIHSIDHYPAAPSYGTESQTEVPTELWYPERMSRDSRIRERNEDDGSTDEIPLGEDSSISGDSDISMKDVEKERHDPNNPLDDDNDSMDENSNGELEKLSWGYQVLSSFKHSGSGRDKSLHITRSKLLFDQSEHTKTIRNELDGKVKELRTRNIIRCKEDLIVDFLERLFIHTREQMNRRYRYRETDPIEFVLCLPVKWNSKACRDMQNCMCRALKRAKFITEDNSQVNNLFIVSEPEAAAAYVLAQRQKITVQTDESFVLLDAGGGTVDAITYQVRSKWPLRLRKEVGDPEGELCGSSYLNEKFHRLIFDRLQHETYLETNGITIGKIVDSCVVDFEQSGKRSIDITSRHLAVEPIDIQYLRPDNYKGFGQNKLKLDSRDLRTIFIPCLEKTAKLMHNQLQGAERDQNVEVKKVILVGGFAGSPSLQRYLEKELAKHSRNHDRDIQMIWPHVPSTAVSAGAVLRALRKEDGPERKLKSSFGFLRTEPFDPEYFTAHREQRSRVWYDRDDGLPYIKNSIFWFAKKGDILPPRWSTTIPFYHTFGARLFKTGKLRCGEVLYVSDDKLESHYGKLHPRNKGKYEVAGTVTADMTRLREEGRVPLITPEPGEKGRRHYRVDFDMVITVDDRNLQYEVRWPQGSMEEDSVQAKGHISIAAAFDFGTA